MSAQSANQTLHALHEAGLVRRRPDPDHGRIRSIELTAHGRSVLDACESAVEKTEQLMLARLGADPKKRLLASLKTCLQAIDASYHG